MKKIRYFLAALMVVVAVLLFAPFALTRVVDAQATSTPAATNTPKPTKTPRPTRILDVRKFPLVPVRSNWSSAASAWSDIQAVTHLNTHPACNLNLHLVATYGGSNYGVLAIDAFGDASFSKSFSHTPASGARVSILSVQCN